MDIGTRAKSIICQTERVADQTPEYKDSVLFVTLRQFLKRNEKLFRNI